MKINFASALGVGVSADVEYMDMDLLEEVAVSDVLECMNAQAPAGFGVLDAKYIPDKTPKLMAMANFSTYVLSGPVMNNISQEQLQEILDAFNEQAVVEYEKVSPKNHRTRTIDVKKHIPDPIHGEFVDGMIKLNVGILQTAEGSIKPIQIWEVLAEQFGIPVYADMMLAERKGIYHREEGCSSLFDVAMEN
jgi:radical SAM-linked protein